MVSLRRAARFVAVAAGIVGGVMVGSRIGHPLTIGQTSAFAPPLQTQCRGLPTEWVIDVTGLAHGTGPAFVLLDYSSISTGDAREAVSAYTLPDELGERTLALFSLADR